VLLVVWVISPRSGSFPSITKSLASRPRFQYKDPDTRMKNDWASSSRRGSIVIQTMLARLAKEEEEYKQRKAGITVDAAASPKALATRP